MLKDIYKTEEIFRVYGSEEHTNEEVRVAIDRKEYYFFKVAAREKPIPLILAINVCKQERNNLNYTIYHSKSIKNPTKDMLEFEDHDIEVLQNNPKIVKVYDERINSSKLFSRDYIYFSIFSPQKLLLGLKI